MIMTEAEILELMGAYREEELRMVDNTSPPRAGSIGSAELKEVLRNHLRDCEGKDPIAVATLGVCKADCPFRLGCRDATLCEWKMKNSRRKKNDKANSEQCPNKTN